jgi:hypothetical protein
MEYLDDNDDGFFNGENKNKKTIPNIIRIYFYYLYTMEYQDDFICEIREIYKNGNNYLLK